MSQADRAAVAQAIQRLRRLTRQLAASTLPLSGNEAIERIPASPPVWVYGHVGWFQERWCLRRPGPGAAPSPSRLPAADALFDAVRVPPQNRWSLDLPPLESLDPWLERVLDETLARLEYEADDDTGLYYHRLALCHEAEHVEAMVCARNALGLSQPGPEFDPPEPLHLSADVKVAGVNALIGSAPDDGFAFDTEQPIHPVHLEPFDIALQPVTNAEFLHFVQDGGYHRPQFWPAGAAPALQGTDARSCPVHWRRVEDRWQMRWFDRWIPLEPFAPVMLIDAFEAQAWCAWANCRLPTESEWEYAAASVPGFEWGHSVWEWTASSFLPFPGFEPAPYRDTPEEAYRSHRVVRGGSFATPREALDRHRRRLLRPERHDTFTGFRTCALR